MNAKRSVLSQQAVARRKKTPKRHFPVFRLVRLIMPVLLKCTLLMVIVAGISLVLMYGYHVTRSSPFIMLETVEIDGVDAEIKNQLIETCGFEPGQTLLSLNLKTIKQKMEEHPWIRSVELSRRFPHTLLVHAEKQQPMALASVNGLHYVNQQCEIFKEVGESDNVDFPVITGISKEGMDLKHQLDRAAEVIHALGSQKEPWSLKNLSEINVANENISLYFSHFPAEIIAASDSLAQKLDGLKKVTRHLEETGRIHLVTGIDLNPLDSAVVAFKKG
jgi:cell division protein FtsQ